MIARVEAAAKALAIELRGKNLTGRDQNAAAHVALAAADAVMFSDAAVDRVARTMYGFSEYKPWDKRGDDLHRIYHDQARAVIAALKGDEG